MTTKVRFTVAYDGTGFCGWQKQKPEDQISVAQVIEEALSKVFNEKITLFASGRTDAGVHALNQVCHFSTHRKIDPNKKWDLCWALNSHLPPSIVAKKAWIAPDDFHATLSATHKTYRYLIVNKPRPSAHLNRYADWVRLPIDIEHLQESSKYLLGNQDFKSFQSVGTPVPDTVREIYKADWEWRKPGVMQFTITGSGFLKQMVRNIVGTSLFLERKGLDPSKMQEIIAAQDRMKAGPPAPAQGLYLMKVYYPQDLDNRCLEL
ncbi:tRNA pseudouridine(38-40) synthase TruA [Bdellovibrio bacteriovorus]|uniref:tRNA pseudouridine synthase A n=1 Tax=Bdellovibrio bacteriovorus (strain ATCC 15356 / DSM 50701 / NCIMB 9529 / HD100) TaxID=264462 RepID=TRUA_BDEBA|nr:tRNA pseudouridine(38-40) synthase TruA [Bdellovibrio bacteriovorus]Q6MQH6.1 RecName: Full=tRNA pseudouridine synthase A; AltName: Full=tRNA pseudouridine(38-40) synthase; AltName: Full=tRNA pseudouridylate synthase I; AltName: Full=tRNA-uridine isomerase I [Bdellovibrio bacteriovorus HD100]AHZ86104.1 pseudouridine synthase [Bdellovibrio bacteriovorus]BEV67029.1 tRNA pseudouridine synthase A [Bdellovibrio bacteriovorus]CAE78471.1 pseudouridylate synthase I [Bdellovibrio bacteriovorus HD100]